MKKYTANICEKSRLKVDWRPWRCVIITPPPSPAPPASLKTPYRTGHDENVKSEDEKEVRRPRRWNQILPDGSKSEH